MALYDNGSLFFFSKRFSHFSALIHIPIHMTDEAGDDAAAPQARNLSIWNNGIPSLSDGISDDLAYSNLFKLCLSSHF